MFMFITIVFLLYSLTDFIKGGIMRKTLYDLSEKIDKYKEDENSISEEEKTKMGIQLIAFFFFGVIWLIIYLAYLANAFNYDIYTYPTATILGLYILSVIYSLIKSKFSKGKHQSRNRSFIGHFKSLLSVLYFAYMLLMLIAY